MVKLYNFMSRRFIFTIKTKLIFFTNYYVDAQLKNPLWRKKYFHTFTFKILNYLLQVFMVITISLRKDIPN